MNVTTLKIDPTGESRGRSSAAPAAVERRGSPESESPWRWHELVTLIAVFIGVFGLANFLELPLGWKDRQEQIGTYLDATIGSAPGLILPLLWAQKCVEGALGLMALTGLLRRSVRLVTASIAGWMVVMIGFAFADVWAADRKELQEHTVYFGIFALMFMVIVGVRAIQATKPDPPGR